IDRRRETRGDLNSFPDQRLEPREFELQIVRTGRKQGKTKPALFVAGGGSLSHNTGAGQCNAYPGKHRRRWIRHPASANALLRPARHGCAYHHDRGYKTPNSCVAHSILHSVTREMVTPLDAPRTSSIWAKVLARAEKH